MALPFGTAVMQIEAADEQLRRDLREAEAVVEKSVGNMQADFDQLTVSTNAAGAQMIDTSQAAGVLSQSLAITGIEGTQTAATLVSVSASMRALVVSTAAANTAIVGFGAALKTALLPLLPLLAAVGVAVAAFFGVKKLIAFESGVDRANEALERTEKRLASIREANIGEAKVLAEQAAERDRQAAEAEKLLADHRRQALEIDKQREQVAKERRREEEAILKQIEAQEAARRAELSRQGPQTVQEANAVIMNLIRLDQARERGLAIMESVLRTLGPAARDLAEKAGLLGPGDTSTIGQVGFTSASAFSAATLGGAQLSPAGGVGRGQQSRDQERNSLLRSIRDAGQQTVRALQGTLNSGLTT